MFIPRDYQIEALDALRANIRKGIRRQIMCAPTGAGKSVLAAILMDAARQKGSRSAFIVDRQTLVYQTSDKLVEGHIMHGVVKAREPRSPSQLIQVCSAQTLEAIARRAGDNLPLIAQDQDLVIIDEAHDIRKAVKDYILGPKQPLTIGLTATPFTRGLGKIYQAVVNAKTTDQLTAEGWLAPMRAFVATPIDMDGAKVVAGEWSDDEVEKRAIPITGDVVNDWVRHTKNVFGGPVKTICFSSTVAHGEAMCRQFGELGYDFQQVSYRDKDSDERQWKIQRLKEGRIDGLISVSALSKGFDAPDIKCVILARPYRSSLSSHIQSIGRGLRAAPDKDFVLVLDHGGNVLRFAPDTERFWANGWHTLDDGKKRKASTQTPPDRTRECRECKMVMPPDAQMCPNCGAARPRRQNNVQTQAGVMREYKRELGDIWPDLSAMAMQKYPGDPDKAMKWARGVHNGIMGDWPAWGRPLQPASQVDYRVVELVNKNAKRYWSRKKRDAKRAKESQQNLTI